MEVITQNTWKFASWGNESIQALRKNAIDLFNAKGLPEVKVELYKYSNIQRLFDTYNYNQTESVAIPTQISELPFASAGRIVIKNGILDSASSIDGVNIINGASASDWEVAFTNHEIDSVKALLLATTEEGVCIDVAKNTSLDLPVEIVILNDGEKGSFLSQQHLIKAGANSKVSFVIRHINSNPNPNFNIISFQSIVAENAHVSLFDEQLNNDKDSAVFYYSAKQDKNSHWGVSQTTLHGRFSRTNIFVDQAGEAAHTELSGVFMPNQDQHFDIHSFIGHNKPYGTSDEVYKGIAGANGKGFFNGKVYVARDAQKINAYQSNKNVLLSRDASINSKPELEIYADDVKCSHGSTTGQLDDTALFYMQARGIRKSEASKLLLEAFASDVFEKIENEDLRSYFKEKVYSIL